MKLTKHVYAYSACVMVKVQSLEFNAYSRVLIDINVIWAFFTGSCLLSNLTPDTIIT